MTCIYARPAAASMLRIPKRDPLGVADDDVDDVRFRDPLPARVLNIIDWLGD